MGGFIKLYRKLLEWEWIGVPEMVSVWIHFLLDANYAPGYWKGTLIERGQVPIGRTAYSKRCGISERQFRTCIQRLKSSNQVTVKTTNKYSVVTICQYEQYQSKDDETTNETTNTASDQRPTNDQQTTTTKEIKKNKKERTKEYTVAFLEFWKVYPRKADKISANKAWTARMKDGVSPEAIVKGAEAYALKVEGTEEKYIKLPATFLNAGSYENDPMTAEERAIQEWVNTP